eukprot:2551932-Pyramimonas_sp.AAC.1
MCVKNVRSESPTSSRARPPFSHALQTFLRRVCALRRPPEAPPARALSPQLGLCAPRPALNRKRLALDPQTPKSARF